MIELLFDKGKFLDYLKYENDRWFWTATHRHVCNRNHPMMTTQKQVRKAFWQAWRNGEFKGLHVTPRTIPDYSGNGRMHNTDTRCTFADWLDAMDKDGELAEGLADRVTL